MRHVIAWLLAVISAFVAAPLLATTTCQVLNGPGPQYLTYYECIQSGPTASYNFTYYAPSQDSMCYLYPSGGLYKSIGAYGYGYGHWPFTSPDGLYGYFSIKVIVDLNNTHYHAGNRIAVLVYDDDSYTVENLGEISGSGGDVCSGTYTFNVYRPGWVDKHLRLSLSTGFQDDDANIKVGFVSITVYDRQTW